METFPDAEVGAVNLLRNRQELGQKIGLEESPHTPPASHYPHIYLWDSGFAVIINARTEGRRWLDAAKTELLTVLRGQEPDGFIPNMQFAAKGRAGDPERWLAFGKDAKGSNYTQPPVLAVAAAEVMNRGDDTGFLEQAYPALHNFYSYFEARRSNSGEDKLIGVIHPHETGRDSDPTFNHIKPWRLKRQGPDTPQYIDKINVPIDYFSIIAHGRKLRSANGDIDKAREIYWVNDVMMNCIYADNLYEMAGLAATAGREDDARHFDGLAQTVEQQILTRMWFENPQSGDGTFYALNRGEEPILETSVSNLFPLVLPNLREEQLESLLDLMDNSFDTPYPLPSVATDSPNYDPHNRETDRLWQGPTWINTNWYIAERGLKRQAGRADLSHRSDLRARCDRWSKRIATSSRALLDMNGPYEHYNPVTGKGQRPRVKNFAWSNLAYVM